MLVLSRKVGESIIISDEIEIIIRAVDGENVRIGINAPKEIKVYRKELLEQIKATNHDSLVKIEKNQLIHLIKGKKEVSHE